MADITEIKNSDITVFSDRLPFGIYQARLCNLEATATQHGDPALRVTVGILSGDYKGSTYSWSYYLKASPPKTRGGSPFSYGWMHIKRDAQSLGLEGKLPETFPIDAVKAKIIFNRVFGQAPIRILISEGKEGEDGKRYNETRMLPYADKGADKRSDESRDHGNPEPEDFEDPDESCEIPF